MGPWSGKCEFMYDKSFPGKPNVFSSQYPATNVYHDGVGAPGTFTFSPNPNDAVPDTDVVKYRYTFAGETAKEVANTAAGGPASVTWTPTRSGPHWVDVVAVDKAGHPSALARHSFYVAAGAAAAAQWNLADEAGGNAADEEQGKYPAASARVSPSVFPDRAAPSTARPASTGPPTAGSTRAARCWTPSRASASVPGSGPRT